MRSWRKGVGVGVSRGSLLAGDGWSGAGLGLQALRSRAHHRPRAGSFVALFLCALAARAEPTFFKARVEPIFDRHCVACHGEKKQKAGLRLDTFEHALRGGEAGAVIAAGEPKKSELFRRITLPAEDDEVMPSDGKPLLSRDEIKLIEIWIASGASATSKLADYPTAPVPPAPKPAALPLAPDWRPRAPQIAALERELGVRLAPRSQTPTDGLVLRTASAPGRCDDAALARLAPVADLIVEAELARTKITDAGLASLAGCENLRAIDLTRTAVSSAGVTSLAALKKLESLNLTATRVDAAGAAKLKELPALRQLWLFATPADSAEVASASSP